MNRVLTANEMQKVDEYTIGEVGIPSPVLMERAAMAVCAEVRREITGKRLLVVCGKGNNGGDGLAVARILSSEDYQVGVYLCGQQKGGGSEGFLYQLGLLKLYPVTIFEQFPDDSWDGVVDAVFGVGLSGTITGQYLHVIERINHMKCPVLSVDCPSGVDCNTGRVLGTAVKAQITVTFGAMKRGLLLYPGAGQAGKVVTADIGFPEIAYETAVKEPVWMTEPEDLYQLAARVPYSNKGTYGKAAVIAGSKNMCGAAVLAARACYSVGAGLVKIITCEENREILQTLVPEAVLATYKGTEISHIEKELEWADVILAGPGLSVNSTAYDFVSMALNQGKPLVLDADAINILSEHRDLLSALKNRDVILTPHLGEMSRLTGTAVPELKEDLLQFCKSFAEEYGVICVLKDARTVISDGNSCVINTSGCCGMAKGGSGDVLAGMITGLVLQKNSIYETAVLGVYLHGLSGNAAAEQKGNYAMSPLDLLEGISVITKKVEDSRK